MQWDARIRSIAQDHEIEPAAAETMARAIQQAGGGVASWDHPQLGGAGTWIPGSTVLSPREPATEKRLDALCLDLLGLLKETTGHATQPGANADSWWPATLGPHPSSDGAQDGVRYAFFSEAQRLAVDRGDGRGVSIFDTAGHEIRSFTLTKASPAGLGEPVFQSQFGRVALHQLRSLPPPRA